ncbi:MAG: prenyltransferase/squalene oxidase repeat-containing protein [Kiritimatiellia bacterium]|jgi:squalene-hopene/tetraprenyl-beta-curcumene cyclase
MNTRLLLPTGLAALLLLGCSCSRQAESPDQAPGGAAPEAAEATAPDVSDATDGAAAPAGQATGEQALALINAGLDWLKANQSEDGSWSDPNYPGLSALALWAMARSDRADLEEARAKAAAYIVRYVRSDGSIYKPATGGRGTGGLSTYNTAICMTALHAYDKVRFQAEILKAREFIASSQLEGDSSVGGGGFGYDKPTEGGRPQRADMSNTGLALMSMRLTQDVEDNRPVESAKADVDWASALAFVESMQISSADHPEADGGFGYEMQGERRGPPPAGERKDPPEEAPPGTAKKRESLRTFGSMTYAGIESMIYAQVDRTDPRVRSAIAWAGRNWTVEENPGQGIRGLYYYYVIMAKALALMGEEGLVAEDGTPIDWRGDLVAQLAKTRDEEGFWANEDNTFWESDPSLVTAYAVLCLQSALGL